MPGGNDVHSEQMSIADAKKWCAANPQCKGFTFSGPAGEAPESAVVHVMFKSAGDWAPGDGWHTYVQEDAAPAGPSHDFEYGAGYMPGTERACNPRECHRHRAPLQPAAFPPR
jgi:hypothetical protein